MSKVAEIIETINETTGLELESSKISLDSDIAELGVDSLDVYNILVELEVKTGVAVKEEAADRFVSLKDLLDYFYNDQ